MSPVVRRAADGYVATIARLDRVRDSSIFAGTMLWVIVGGLLLQLVVLPYVFPSVHRGHGLLIEQDSFGYHQWAAQQAERIRQQGWGAWELRPEGHFVSGLASITYRLVAPEPWAMLPVNGIFFAIAVVSVRRLLTLVSGSRGLALIGMVPFFMFPSFIPIWGQLQKDVATGAGFCLTLTAVMVAAKRFGSAKSAPDIRLCVVAAVGGMFLVWLARPYGMVLVCAALFVASALTILSAQYDRRRFVLMLMTVGLTTGVALPGWQSRSLPESSRESVVTDETVDGGAASALQIGQAGQPVVPAPAPPAVPAPAPPAPQQQNVSLETPAAESAGHRITTAARAAIPRTRRIPPTMAVYGACEPAPSHLLDRALFSLCAVREGFIGDARRRFAASGTDYDIRLRTLPDFVAYIPRAVIVAALEPLPSRWLSERSPIGRMGGVFIPFEMIFAYAAFLSLVMLGRSAMRRPEVWTVILFSLGYTLIFAYTMPQLGTLYRMRAFSFALLVSVCLVAAAGQLRDRLAGTLRRPDGISADTISA